MWREKAEPRVRHRASLAMTLNQIVITTNQWWHNGPDGEEGSERRVGRGDDRNFQAAVGSRGSSNGEMGW